MGLRSLLGLISVALAFSLVACDTDKAQKVEPETRGKRGERCMARNDCATGLACIGGVCAKNEFEVDVSAKHCERGECGTDEDCCGDRLTEAPAICDDRVLVCETPTLEGCIQTTCTDATEPTVCGDGFCGAGSCSSFGFTCMTASDCHDVCVAATGTCSLSNVACTLDTQCTYYQYNAGQTCGGRICNCANPVFDQSDPLCTNEDCLNVCNLRCQDKLCVEDDSCETDLDCPATASICDGGVCVECTADDECEEDNDETCENGFCRRGCEFNEECGVFEECDTQSGDCVYVGCKSNLACILAAGRGQTGVGGSGNVSVGSGDDARLYVCLESEVDPSIGVCRIPCENDGNCSQLEVCEAGYCKFVGCVDHVDCRIYLGIANQIVTENKPYVTEAVCTDAPPTDDSETANAN